MEEIRKVMKEKKSIAIRLSQSFEKLSFEIVKCYLKKNSPIKYEKLTQEKKDGGYDGYFIINSDNDLVLMEAKLRSNTLSDLPLSDFAKSVLISINQLANSIFITTNLHFSEETIKKLTIFSSRTGLIIYPLDLRYIKPWIEKNTEIISSVPNLTPLIRFLQNTEIRGADYKIPLTNKSLKTNKTNFKIFGKNRIVAFDEIQNSINKNEGNRNYVVAGPYGIGKSYFIKSVCSNINTIDIDLTTEKTYRDIFISIFYQIWTGEKRLESFTLANFEDCINSVELCLPQDKSSDLKEILFNTQNLDLYDLDTLNLEKYLWTIILPILKRTQTVLYIHNIDSLQDTTCEKFISKIVQKLSSNLAIIIEVDTNRINWDKNRVLYKTCLNNNFKTFDMDEWEQEDASQFLQYKNVPKMLARNLVKGFGSNAAILDSALTLKDVSEQVQIANIISDYSGTNKVRYIFSTIGNILENTLLQQYPFVKSVFFNMHIFDGKYFAPYPSETYSELEEIVRTYSFIRKKEKYFIIVKDAYLNALDGIINNYKIEEIREYAKQALIDMKYYCLDNVQQCGKLLQIGMLCGDTKLIIDNYKVYINYLHKQKAFPQSKILLVKLYKFIQDGQLIIDTQSTFSILNLIIESYLNMGDGDDSVNEYLDYANELICLHSEDWDTEEHYSYDKARYLKKNCGLCLRRGKYNDLISFAEEGINLLKKFTTYRCNDMQYEFWNYKALGVKHLYNLTLSIQVYRDCLKNMKCLSSKLIKWFLSARASFYTYRNPTKSKMLLMRVLKMAYGQNYNPRQITHHENNIGSLSLMTLELEDAKTHCVKAYNLAKEYIIRTEEARSQNLLGCLAWLNGNIEEAIKSFKTSSEIFNIDSHETYSWIPLVNLSSVYMEMFDFSKANSMARKSAAILLNSHAEQISRIDVNDLLFSKNYLALLQILRVANSQNDLELIQDVLNKISCETIKNHFKNYIQKNKFDYLVKNSHAILKGHFMLKT